MEDVFVLSAVRTPIGKYGGGLASVPPCDLAAKVVREAVSRAGVEPAQVGQAVFGNVIHTEVRDMYLSRVAAINGGLEIGTPALTVNRLCGSGMQAIVSASQSIMLGDCDVAVAGGAESMSRAPYWLPSMRWGQRMNDGVALDPMVGALSDPFDHCHMGVTAENVATDFHVSREDQDALAAESHRRAAAASVAGYFKEQILPVEIPGKKGTTVVDTDEHIRAEVSQDDMAKLKPAFAKDGTVTAGNASGINDAAAAVVLASESFVSSHGLSPLGRLVGYGLAGVEPRIMGMGPVPATRKVLDRTGLKVERDRRVRGERGLRGSGPGGGQGTGPAVRPDQPERQRDLPRPPRRRLRGHPGRQVAVRAQAHRRPVRPQHHVHRRRAGHRHDLRARLTRDRREVCGLRRGDPVRPQLQSTAVGLSAVGSPSSTGGRSTGRMDTAAVVRDREAVGAGQADVTT